MSDELLEKFIKEYIECQTTPQIMFTWHGGETLMRPLDFYKKVYNVDNKTAKALRSEQLLDWTVENDF